MKILPSKIKRRDFLKVGSIVAGGLMLSTPAKGKKVFFNRTLGQSQLQPNPVLTKLGFSKKDRVLIAQLDDLGICQSNMSAYSDLAGAGNINSAAVMAPSIWFPLVAHLARTNPGLDIGLQMTLTSEWDTIRWRPISTVDPKSGLLDGDGFYPKSVVDLPSSLDQTVLAQEFDAQMNRALKMGVKLTHLDSHQSIAFNPRFTDLFYQFAKKYQLPLVFLRPDPAQWDDSSWMNSGWITEGLNFASQFEQAGLPLLDSITDLSPAPSGSRMSDVQKLITQLPSGLHLIRIHAANRTPEIEAMTPDWEGYVADLNAWIGSDLKSFIQKAGVKTIGWAPIKALMKAG
jgi:chitin disaccharide deacetylase